MNNSEQGVCEVIAGEGPNPLRRTCQRPAVLRYAARGGGYMHLCAEHGVKHERYCERWNGTEWERNESAERAGFKVGVGGR